MRTVRASLVAAAALTLGGCNLDLTNPNQPTVASTLTNPRASISRMVVGVVGNYRDNRAAQIRALGSFPAYYRESDSATWATMIFANSRI